MLKEKRPDIEIVGDEVPSAAEGHRFLALYRQDQGLRRRQRHHRQLGAGHRAPPEGRRRRRPAGELVHLLRRRRRRPDRDQADRPVAPRLRRSRKAFPTRRRRRAQKWEAAFRAKEGVTLFYPRAVNEMRMLAKAANEAKSTDAKAVAEKLEGMKVEVFDGGDGVHAQGRPPVLPAHVHRQLRRRSTPARSSTRKAPAGAGS